jgi:hypothetical protein
MDLSPVFEDRQRRTEDYFFYLELGEAFV